jgi:hypothetical protein
MNSRAYCGAFNFKGGDQQKKVGLLSGGERNRVHMAKLLKRGQRAAARRADQRPRRGDAARAGRRAGGFRRLRGDHQPRPVLPRPLCTHILAFEGEAHVEWFEGNFEDYEEDKKRRLGPDALEPKRVKYKKVREVGCRALGPHRPRRQPEGQPMTSKPAATAAKAR